MGQRAAVIFLLVLLTFSGVSAQTETPVPTHTPTPEVSIFWELPTEEVEEGATPEPAQEVVFGYSANAGDVMVVFFLAAILAALWGAFLTLYVFNRSKGS